MNTESIYTIPFFLIGQTSRTPASKTKVPPLISSRVMLSFARTAADVVPTITSVIKRIPTRAGSRRGVAHIKLATESAHHIPPAANAQPMIRPAFSSTLREGRGSRKGASKRAPRNAPTAKTKADSTGSRSDRARMPVVAIDQRMPEIKANHSPKPLGKGMSPFEPSMTARPTMPHNMAAIRRRGVFHPMTKRPIKVLQTGVRKNSRMMIATRP